MSYSENCGCGGNSIDRFYALFTCDRANCNECHWTNNQCCIGSYIKDNTNSDGIGDCTNGCLNYYNIPMQEVVTSKIKSFGFCKTSEEVIIHHNPDTGEDEESTIIIGALALQFVDGTKKLYTNVSKEVYDVLTNANKDYLFINASQSVCTDESQCIIIP